MVPANATPPLLGDDAPVHFVLMIAVVTGSSGFIGSHVVDALLARGATVRVLRRPESPASHDPRVAQWTADLLDDRSVRESPIWKDVTHVFHAGGVTKRRTLAEFRYGNVVPTANILSALVARGRPSGGFGTHLFCRRRRCGHLEPHLPGRRETGWHRTPRDSASARSDVGCRPGGKLAEPGERTAFPSQCQQDRAVASQMVAV